jgi:putative pyruvate formate lyase activating enzyme
MAQPPRPWRAGYAALARTGEIDDRVDRLEELLADCTVCPRSCRVDRHAELGECATGAEAVIASWSPHHGEEPVISAHRGSGTVFLANCNLRCAFCQNHDISQRPQDFLDSELPAERLAGIFLDLQDRGCHNINWVSPSHQVPQLMRALAVAARRGLSVPIVYNSNGYDSVHVLELLDGVVDIYMPDLKYADPDEACRLSEVDDYPIHARAALAEMYRQLGDTWQLGPDGALQRGLLMRPRLPRARPPHLRRRVEERGRGPAAAHGGRSASRAGGVVLAPTRPSRCRMLDAGLVTAEPKAKPDPPPSFRTRDIIV